MADGTDPKPSELRQTVEKLVQASLELAQAQAPVKVMRHAIASARVPIVITDCLDSAVPIVYANRAFLELTGFTEAEIVGRDCFFMQGPATDGEAIRTIRDGISAGVEVNVLTRAYRKDGTSFWDEIHLSPVSDEGGHITHYIGFHNDVSAAIELRELVLRKEQLVLKAAKFSALNDMASSIAHEINNPLAVVAGHVERLRQLAAGGTIDGEDFERRTEKIETALDRIARIVRGLRLFSKEPGLEPEQTVRLSQIVHDALNLSGERFQGHGVELVVRNRAPGLELRARPLQLQHALINLLNNAFDAVANAPLRRVSVELDATRTEIILAVIDTGGGIASEHHAHMMEPFFTTKPLGSAIGLGLSTSRGIAEAHGGSLRYERRANETRFEIVLPAALALPESSAA